MGISTQKVSLSQRVLNTLCDSFPNGTMITELAEIHEMQIRQIHGTQVNLSG